jgi:hypothetical protein
VLLLVYSLGFPTVGIAVDLIASWLAPEIGLLSLRYSSLHMMDEHYRS